MRTRFLLNTLKNIEGISLYQAINDKKGILRYPQTLWRLLKMRISHNPDLYILGFRGHEIYWPVRLITVGKPLIFDEFLDAYAYITQEHKRLRQSGLTAKIFAASLKIMFRSSQLVLTDTKLHADEMKQTFNLSDKRVDYLYVGTDEHLFERPASFMPTKKFKVFFYGSFLPLHGVDQIVEAAKLLEDTKVEFEIIGGAKRSADMERFLAKLKEDSVKNITHLPWVEFKQIPAHIAKADLCLGGPFGNTPQAQKVISGKVFQFLHMAKPVVVGKINENVGFSDKGNCLLVEQGDAKKLAAAIRWAYNNQTELQKIGESGQKLYQEKFSVAAQKDHLEKIISDLV